MELVLSTALFAALLSSIFAFNIDIHQPVIRNGTGGPGKLFGYSVAAYKNDNNWILVGAPRDDSDGQAEYGALYRCEMKRDSVCQPFTGLPKPKIEPDHFEGMKLEQRDIVRGQWLGVAVAASAAESGLIVACAHRYADRTENFQQWHPVGRCLVFNSSFGFQSELAHCFGAFDFLTCQSGTDVKLAKDGSVLIGSPGAHDWQGNSRVVDLNDHKKFAQSGSTADYSYLGYSVDFGSFHFHGSTQEYVVGVPRSDQYKGKVDIFSYNLESKDTQVSASISGEQETSYFGHTVAAADLNRDGFDDVLVGAPYYTGSLRDQGRVYSYINSQKSSFTSGRVLTGSLAKGSFGYSIAVVGNLDNDIGGYVEIAIGAPFADHPTIYIYSTSKNGISEKPTQVISASSLNVLPQDFAGFGSALSGGVDLDGDDYPDIIVGAFLSEKVVVLRPMPVADVIATLQLLPNFLNYPTRNRFVATLCMKCEGKISESFLNITVAMEVDAGLLSSRVTFIDTGLAKSSFFLNVTQELKCHNNSLILQPNIKNLIKPVTVDVHYSLQEPPPLPSSNGNPDLSTHLPSVLRSKAPFKLSKSAYLLSGCRLESECVPDLQIKSAVVSPSGVLTVGETRSVSLAFSVLNNDEAAFAANVRITFIKELTLEHITYNKRMIFCDEKSENFTTSATCEIGNPLPSKQQVDLEFVFLLGRLPFTTRSINISIDAGSANPENGTLGDNRLVVGPVKLISLADFGIQGISAPTRVAFNPAGLGINLPRVIPEIGRTVDYFFSVQNKGPSSIPQSEIVINWPWKTNKDQHLLYIVGINVVGRGQCNADFIINPCNLPAELNAPTTSAPSTSSIGRQKRYDIARKKREAKIAGCGTGRSYAVCKSFTCSLDNMEPGDKIDFRIHARLYEHTLLRDGITTLNITSLATMKLSSDDLIAVDDQSSALPKRVSITTYVVDAEIKDEKTKLWVIPVVVVASILSMTLVIILLVYLGFFKRDSKNKLEKEKEKEIGSSE